MKPCGYPGEQMLGALRTQNQAQNLEAAGKAYLTSFLVLNRMSVRLLFLFFYFQSGPSKRGLIHTNISLDRRGELALLLVPKWHVLWWIIGNPQGLVNVLIEHHPIIGNIISNRYLKVMFKVPKKGHLPTPDPMQLYMSQVRIKCPLL